MELMLILLFQGITVFNLCNLIGKRQENREIIDKITLFTSKNRKR